MLTVDLAVVDRAKDIVLGNLDVSARDAIHAAVIDFYNVDAIFSFDRDFDRIPGIRRITQ